MNELALFAGAGGGILGGRLLDWHTVAAVEIERYPRECLLQRQRDGIFPKFPIWDDVTTFDGKPWRGLVDVVSGGFPCQDISAAGKGAGIDGARSGLWSEMFRIICEVRPRFAFMENSPMLTSRGLHRVLGDLAEAGYHAAWLVLGAGDIGAPHQRDRIWILGVPEHADGDIQSAVGAVSARKQKAEPDGVCHTLPDTDGIGLQTLQPIGSMREKQDVKMESGQPARSGADGRANVWAAESGLGRMVDGVAHRVDRLKAIGNGQVPLVAAIAFETLRRRLEKHFPLT